MLIVKEVEAGYGTIQVLKGVDLQVHIDEAVEKAKKIRASA